MVTTFSISSGRSMGPILGVIFPLSILDISRTSLIRLSRCWLEDVYKRQGYRPGRRGDWPFVRFSVSAAEQKPEMDLCFAVPFICIVISTGI